MRKRETSVDTMRRVLANVQYCKLSTRNFSYVFDKDILSLRSSPDEWRLVLSDNWSVREYPNGGYLSAICIRACQDLIPSKSPISLSSHFFNKTEEFKELVVDIKVLGQSKSSTTLSAIFSQEKKRRCAFMLTLSSISSSKASASLSDYSCPNLPPPHECESGSDNFRNLKVSNRTEFKLPKHSEFIKNVINPLQKGKSAEYECWLKFADDRPVCSTSLAFLADSTPPPILAVLDAHWLPTVEYNVQFWGVPIADQYVDGTMQLLLEGQGLIPWVRARYSTRYVNHGMLCTDGQIWSENGSTLLANSRQLAKILI